jgi:hypothetical protein
MDLKTFLTLILFLSVSDSSPSPLLLPTPSCEGDSCGTRSPPNTSSHLVEGLPLKKKEVKSLMEVPQPKKSDKKDYCSLMPNIDRKIAFAKEEITNRRVYPSQLRSLGLTPKEISLVKRFLNPFATPQGRVATRASLDRESTAFLKQLSIEYRENRSRGAWILVELSLLNALKQLVC